jgi:HNH endonuclease
MESEPVRRQAPLRKRAAGNTVGLGTSALCSWMVNRPGGWRPFEAGWGARAPGGRVLRHPLATTQLVEGACLIRRYRAVRSRGGQPARSGTLAGVGNGRHRQRRKLWLRQDKTCPWCGRPITSAEYVSAALTDRDHVIPKSHGGQGRLHNLQLLHRQCNIEKGDSCPGCERCDSLGEIAQSVQSIRPITGRSSVRC